MISLEGRFWTHSNSTNSTGVCGLHFLNVHLTGGSGFMTYEVMKMITVEPNVRDSDSLSTDFLNSRLGMLA